MNELEEFLQLNNIAEDDIFSALHLDIREIILKVVCEKLKKDPSFFNWAKKTYFLNNDFDATTKVIDRVCKCKLSKNDTLWMQSCIKAYFAKSSTRRIFTKEEKEHLLKIQDGKCAICGCSISITNMHVDHIIPWDYVGDKLDDNLQGLCEACNTSKSNHVAKTVTNLIVHRR